MNALVTGGSGFLGRNLIRALVARGDRVVALARSDAAQSAVKDAGADEVVRGDLDDVDVLARGMNGCDTVFHSAAIAEDWGDPELFFRVNVRGTENALAAAKTAGVSRFVHVGTEAVLVGGRPIVMADETWPLPEHPIGLYPTTKGLAEKAVIAANSEDLVTVVVRPRFIWGDDDTSVLPKLVEAVRDGRFRWVAGGHYKTSTCHVRNVVEGTLLAAEKGQGGECYFLTDGEPVECRQFLTDMLRTQGVEPGDKSIPRWVARAASWTIELVWRMFSVRREPPITRTAVRLIGEEVTVDDSKAREQLGYKAELSIEAGLEEMARSEAAGAK